MERRTLHPIVVAICALALACQPRAEAGRDGGSPIPIAVVPFGVAPGSPPPPIDVAAVIRAELVASGRFAPLAEDALPAHPTRLSAIRFDEWRRAETDYVVVGLVAQVHDGGHEVEFRVVDARRELPLVGYQVPSGLDELAPTAQRIAAIIEERLTVAPD